jgi:hypothetical protein
MLAKGIPETMQLSADRLDILLGGRSAVFRIFDELRPSSRRVAKPRQV